MATITLTEQKLTEIIGTAVTTALRAATAQLQKPTAAPKATAPKAIAPKTARTSTPRRVLHPTKQVTVPMTIASVVDKQPHAIEATLARAEYGPNGGEYLYFESVAGTLEVTRKELDKAGANKRALGILNGHRVFVTLGK
jgi:hypothetical protein